MKIEVENTRCRVVEWPPEPWDKKLTKDFTKKAKDAFWAQRNTPGWSGATSFISPKRGQFATGLLPLVLKWCIDEDIEVEIDDKRDVPKPQGPKPTVDFLDGIELRDYQLEAIEKALDEHRGLIKCPTGSGKTAIATSIIKAIGHKTLFIVDRVNLATQTKKAMVKFGVKDIGIVGGGRNEQNNLVVITTIQSAHKIDNLDEFKVVIADESHHTKSKSYIKLLKEMKNAYYRFGLSGTVFGEDPVDDYYRISQFGDVIYEIGTQQLIEAGVLSKPTIRMIEINKPWAGSMGKYLDQYKLGIANNHYRNNIIAKFGNNFKGKTVVLFKLIEHGEQLRSRMPQGMYVDGNTDYATRDQILRGFNAMPQGLLIASTIMDEGIDFSSIQHLIIAGGEKSIIKGIQRLGRGLRTDGNPNDTVNVIDFMDRTSNILERHSKKRIKLYQSEGHTVKLFQLGDVDDE